MRRAFRPAPAGNRARCARQCAQHGRRAHRWPHAAAQQLRKPRVPGGRRRRAAGSREILSSRALERCGHSRRACVRRRSRRARNSGGAGARVGRPHAAHVRRFRFSIFENRGGRAPDLDRRDTLEWLGRFIGRIHAVGQTLDYTNVRPSTSTPSATSRATSCSRNVSCPTTARRVGNRGESRA